jgi:hypothetical protein
MPTITLRYAVTFEYQSDAPETIRGEIDVSNPSLGVRRAFEAAKRAYPHRRWSSVVVLLERPEEAKTLHAAAA